ncbi:MAG TPA: hypothetical protein VHD84_02240 [Candidatus Saccharimonadales bacterium]|nr:hypothetical protein [Candidatus Saccharimonadales bacterium]
MVTYEALTALAITPQQALEALRFLQGLEISEEALANPRASFLENEQPKVLAEIIAALGEAQNTPLPRQVIAGAVGPEFFEASLISVQRQRQRYPRHSLHIYSTNPISGRTVYGIHIPMRDDFALDPKRKITASWRGELAAVSKKGKVSGNPKSVFEALEYSAANIEYLLNLQYPSVDQQGNLSQPVAV